ncbi:MAG: glycosyltransferase family 2 protein [Nanoarchaeota archaeon]
MKLSVLIPVYNEMKTLAEIIKRVESVRIDGFGKEIIVIDDCSTDGSADFIRNLKGRNIKKFFHQVNRGKGAAVRTGLSHATGSVIIIQDADLEYNPGDYRILLDAMHSLKADVVYGTRMSSLTRKQMHTMHYFGNKILTFFTNMLYHCRITDMETCYKMFRREVVRGMNLKARKFDFEPEITAKILKRGYKIYEVPINFNPRTFREGKKITWKDGLVHLYYIIKYRFFD